MSNPISVKTLLDDPAPTDAFGSHQRIASVLASFIDSEPGGKAIALTGAWGSGKSTVIRLLRQCLVALDKTRSANTLIYEFDAWAHEGDSLRRAFLESLGCALCDEKWIKKDFWQTESWKLSHKEDESVTTSKPVLTNWGIALSVSLLLVPFGYALIRLVDSNTSIWRQAYWYVVLICVSAPALIATLAWLIGRRNIPKMTTIFGKEQPRTIGFADVFLEHRNSVSYGTTVRRPDPTSIEFEQIYSNLLRTSLEDKSHRLCIVVDNLDRLEPAEVVAIWSTLRLFFSRSLSEKPSFVDRLWVVASFDRRGLQRRIQTEQPELSSELDGLLDKTFDLAFRVPEPPLLTWRQYLTSCLLEAFPDYPNKEDFGDVEYIFDRLKPTDKPVTPRLIKKFVNRLGASVRQWAEEVSLVTQAVYTLKFADDPNSITNLQRDDFLPPGILAMLSATAREDMVRMQFMTDPEKAAYLLWGNLIKTAIRTRENESVAAHWKTEGFRVALEQSMVEDLTPSKASTVSEYALFLNNLQEQNSTFNASPFWRLLQAHCIMTLEWDVLGYWVQEGFQIVISRSSGLVWPNVLSSLATATHKEGIPPEKIQGLLGMVGSLYRGDSQTQLNIALPFGLRFRVDLPPTELMNVFGRTSWIDASNEVPRSFFQFSRQTIVDLVNFLVKACNEKELPPEAAKSVSLLLELTRGAREWFALSRAVRERLGVPEATWSNDSATLLRLASVLPSNEALDASLLWEWVTKRFGSGIQVEPDKTAEILWSVLLASSRNDRNSNLTLSADTLKWFGGESDDELGPVIDQVVQTHNYDERREIRRFLKQNNSLFHLRDLILRKAVDLGWYAWAWIDIDEVLESPESYQQSLGNERFRRAIDILRTHAIENALKGNGSIGADYRLGQLAKAIRLGNLLGIKELDGETGTDYEEDNDLDDESDEDERENNETDNEDSESLSGDLVELAQDIPVSTSEKVTALLIDYANELLVEKKHYLRSGVVDDVELCLGLLDSAAAQSVMNRIINLVIRDKARFDALLQVLGKLMTEYLSASPNLSQVLPELARRVETTSETSWLSGLLNDPRVAAHTTADTIAEIVAALSESHDSNVDQANSHRGELLSVLQSRGK